MCEVLHGEGLSEEGIAADVLRIGQLFRMTALPYQENRYMHELQGTSNMLAELVAGTARKPDIDAHDMGFGRSQVRNGGIEVLRMQHAELHAPESVGHRFPQRRVVLNDESGPHARGACEVCTRQVQRPKRA